MFGSYGLFLLDYHLPAPSIIECWDKDLGSLLFTEYISIKSHCFSFVLSFIHPGPLFLSPPSRLHSPATAHENLKLPLIRFSNPANQLRLGASSSSLIKTS